MFTRVKTPAEIAAMRESGKILAQILSLIDQKIEPGMTGLGVSAIAKKELKACGATGPFMGYMGYPDVICISYNDEIVHGIPNAREFKDGDVVSFDFGVKYRGMITDSAFTKIIGASTKTKKRLLKETERSLYAGIDGIKNGVRVGDIAASIQEVLDRAQLGIIRELVGHGVGHMVHEEPNIPNYGHAGTGPVLKTGMTIAIEPMTALGGYSVIMDPDGWTIRTADGTPAAHFEHTVLITDNGCEILTAR